MISNYSGGDNLVIVFDDKTGDDRGADVIYKMVEELDGVAKRFGFKWSTYGTRAQLRQRFHDEQAKADREDLADMLAEHRRKREAEESEER